METITIDKDITVMYVTASSFPDGIMEAHKKLHELVPFSTERQYYGISRPENGTIVYRAAAEKLHAGEAEKFHLDELVLKKGKYTSLTIHDYMKDWESMPRAFKELLADPGIDPQGYCVEWYLSKTAVTCMVRLKD